MPTWMKVLLIVGGVLLLLLVALVGAGYFVVRRYGPDLLDAGKQTVTEGAEYGRRTDNEGCLNEGVARQARADGFTSIVRNGVFLRACLETSRPTPGFCDGVPRQGEFMKAFGWQAQQCQRFGLKPEQQCGQLFQQVQLYCEKNAGARGANANANANEATGWGTPDDPGDPPPPPEPRRTPAPAR